MVYNFHQKILSSSRKYKTFISGHRSKKIKSSDGFQIDMSIKIFLKINILTGLYCLNNQFFYFNFDFQ